MEGEEGGGIEVDFPPEQILIPRGERQRRLLRLQPHLSLLFLAAGRRVTAVSGASSHRAGDSQWQAGMPMLFTKVSCPILHPHMPTCPWLSHASCWCSHTMPPPTGRAMPPMPVAVRCLMPAPEVGILASGIKHPIPPPVPGNQDVAGEFVKICIFDLGN